MQSSDIFHFNKHLMLKACHTFSKSILYNCTSLMSYKVAGAQSMTMKENEPPHGKTNNLHR